MNRRTQDYLIGQLRSIRHWKRREARYAALCRHGRTHSRWPHGEVSYIDKAEAAFKSWLGEQRRLQDFTSAYYIITNDRLTYDEDNNVIRDRDDEVILTADGKPETPPINSALGRLIGQFDEAMGHFAMMDRILDEMRGEDDG